MACSVDPSSALAWMQQGQLCLLPCVAVGFILAMLIGPGTIVFTRWLDERRWSRLASGVQS